MSETVFAPPTAKTRRKSFLTCYHFGYHKEHHKNPYFAWWLLPKAYKQDKNKTLESAL